MTATWQAFANCLGTSPTLFFPEKSDTPVAAHAKAVCSACSVRDACLEYALANNEEHGIWGGLAPRELRAERRRRGLTRAHADGCACCSCVRYRRDNAHRDGCRCFVCEPDAGHGAA